MADPDLGTVRLHTNQYWHQFVVLTHQILIGIDIKHFYTELTRLRMGMQRRKHVIAQVAIGP